MKRVVVLLLCVMAAACGSGGDDKTPPPATPMWAWIAGSDLTFQQGTYGAKGTPSVANTPGARAWGASWRDLQGKFWIFGGQGPDSTGTIQDLNELWVFDPEAHTWGWMSGGDVGAQSGVYGTQGVADTSNVPGSRTGCVAWTDRSGDLWLFGGWGYDAAGTRESLNDLWRYDPAANQWTWMSGSDLVHQPGVYGTKGIADPANHPGARNMATAAVDPSGKFWLFGGVGLDASGSEGTLLNDLWTYDPTTGEWTWISGSDTGNQKGLYINKGVPDPYNVPGGRYGAAGQLDPGGNLWISGGNGNDSTPNYGVLNDLWKFNGSHWAWISGSDWGSQSGVYGTKGTASSSNVPGSRQNAAAWVDSRGRLFYLGGWGYDSFAYGGYLNDLWEYDGANWTWLSGSDRRGQPGVYGSKGVATASNVPGARDSAFAWIAADGGLWLFGGFGMSLSGQQQLFNDMWRYGK